MSTHIIMLGLTYLFQMYIMASMLHYILLSEDPLRNNAVNKLHRNSLDICLLVHDPNRVKTTICGIPRTTSFAFQSTQPSDNPSSNKTQTRLQMEEML